MGVVTFSSLSNRSILKFWLNRDSLVPAFLQTWLLLKIWRWRVGGWRSPTVTGRGRIHSISKQRETPGNFTGSINWWAGEKPVLVFKKESEISSFPPFSFPPTPTSLSVYLWVGRDNLSKTSIQLKWWEGRLETDQAFQRETVKPLGGKPRGLKKSGGAWFWSPPHFNSSWVGEPKPSPEDKERSKLPSPAWNTGASLCESL